MEFLVSIELLHNPEHVQVIFSFLEKNPIGTRNFAFMFKEGMIIKILLSGWSILKVIKEVYF